MNELLKNFGVQLPLLVAQIVNFLVIFWVLKKYMYKPVLKMLEDRRKTIQESLKDAEETKKLLSQTQEKEKEVLRKAQAEAHKIMEETKAQAKELMAKTELSTRKQADAILAEAREQISRDAKDTEKRLATHVTELAVELLQTSLSGVFSEKDQEIIMENALKRMKGKSN